MAPDLQSFAARSSALSRWIFFVAAWCVSAVGCGSGPTLFANTVTGNENASNGTVPTTGLGSGPQLSIVNGVGTLPMSGCVAFDYFAKVNVGGQTLNLLIDSGSTTMAVAVNTCSTCSPAKTYALSSTGSKVGRSVSSVYGDGSRWTGQTYSDLVAVGDSTSLVTPPIQLTFAGITNSNSFFETIDDCADNGTTAFDGIFGTGPDTQLVPGTTSFMSQLAQSRKLAHDAFAVKTCDIGGTLSFGGFDANGTTAAPSYTPLLEAGSIPAYHMNVSAMGLGSTDFGVSPAGLGPMVVDNGTNSLLLSSAAFNRFVAIMQQNPVYRANFSSDFISGATGFCSVAQGGLTRAQLDAQLPPFTITLPEVNGGTFQLSLPATSSYLAAGYIQGDPNKTVHYCPAVGESDQVFIFGNSGMRSHVVIFDRENQQLGFAPHNTCTPALIPFNPGT